MTKTMKKSKPQECEHTWPSLARGTDRKCMRCGVTEQSVIDARREEVFSNMKVQELVNSGAATVPNIKDMTKKELLELVHALEAHHNEHHKREEKIQRELKALHRRLVPDSKNKEYLGKILEFHFSYRD